MADDIRAKIREELKGLSPDQLSQLETNVKARMAGQENKVGSTQPSVTPATMQEQSLNDLSALGSGVLNTVTFGHVPQIKAALQTRSISGPEYVQARDEAIAAQNQIMNKNPIPYVAGSVGGALLSGRALAKGASLIPEIPYVAKKGMDIIRAGMAGGAAGFLASPEVKPGEPSGINIQDRLKQGGIGAVLGIGGEMAEKGLQSLKAGLKEYANAQAIRSLGPTKGQVKKLIQKDQIDDVANFVLGKGVLKGAGSPDDVYAATEQIRKDAGKKLGDLYNNILEIQTNPEAHKVYNPELLQKLRDSGFKPIIDGGFLKKDIAKSLVGRAESGQALAKVSAVLDNFAEAGDMITPEQAAKMKGDLDALINYNKEFRELPLAQQELKKVRDFVAKKIEDQADLFGQILGQNKKEELKDLLKTYGNARKVGALVENKIAGDSVNRFFSLTDYLSGGAGFTVGALSGDGDIGDRLKRGATTALGTAIVNKASRTFSPSVQARGANVLSQIPLLPRGTLAGAAGQAAPLLTPLLPRKEK